MDRLKPEMHRFLNENSLKALFQNEIYTVSQFVYCDAQKLAKITLLVFKEILDIKKHFIRKYAAVSEDACVSFQNLLKNSAIISSGIKSIDDLLDGGLHTRNIYEIIGKAASGKTLFSYIFMKNLAFEMKQNCFFLDTKNDFSPKKFVKLCKKYTSHDISNGLSRIFLKKIETKYDLLNSLQEIAQKLQENLTLRLIVIDSLTAIIQDHKDHFENNLILSHISNLMHFIASKYHVVFLVVNLSTNWIEGDFSDSSSAKTTVSCGRFWYTIPNTRIKTEISKDNLGLSVEKSNLLPLNNTNVDLTQIFE